ncbi:MAG: hypothetical protein WC736_14840 [Gallionella sp.]|jgi:hypothetical protein
MSTRLLAELEMDKDLEYLKSQFEEWLPRQFGTHIKDKMKGFDEEDGYHDQMINAMWIGFNAGVKLNK